MATQAGINRIEKARFRRAATAGDRASETKWFIEEVSSKIELTVRQRVSLASEFVRNEVVKNISRPVTKSLVNGVVRVSNRSKPGEFPKADTTNLMKSIFQTTFSPSPGVYDGVIGTPVDYGVTLELQMNRSFLRRTLNENRQRLVKLLSGPIR